MAVPNDHYLLAEIGEGVSIVLNLAVHQDHLVIVASGSVTERDWPQPVDIHGDGQRQTG